MFISESYNFRIGQGTSIYIDKRRINPDISIYHSKDLLAVIQIKVYITGGIKEIDKEIEILEELKTYHPKLRALLIIFMGLSEKGKIFHKLETEKNIREWFNFLMLEGNKEPLKKKFFGAKNSIKKYTKSFLLFYQDYG